MPGVARHALRLALAAALAAAGAVLALTPVAATGAVGLRPAHADPSNPATRAYFIASVAAGATYRDQVVVTNPGGSEVRLYVSAVDGLTAVTSGAVYANRRDPVHRWGAWVTPDVSSLTLPAHGQTTVGFTVRVPADAIPGDHLAGIAFEDANPQTSTGNLAITEVIRTVIGVLIQVPGPGAFHLHIDAAAPRWVEGRPTPTMVITLGDNGRLLGRPQVTATLTGPGGYRRVLDRQLDTLLPGDLIGWELPWPDTLADGDYTVQVSGTGGGMSQPATLTTTFHVGPAGVAEGSQGSSGPEAAPGARGPSGGDAGAAVSRVLSTAWHVILLLVKCSAFPALLILVIVVFLAVQERIDRSDPKLALAPVYAEPDLAFPARHAVTGSPAHGSDAPSRRPHADGSPQEDGGG